jgi:hypothetical protein
MWRVDPLLRGNTADSGRCYVTAANLQAGNNKQTIYGTRFLATDR